MRSQHQVGVVKRKPQCDLKCKGQVLKIYTRKGYQESKQTLTHSEGPCPTLSDLKSPKRIRGWSQVRHLAGKIVSFPSHSSCFAQASFNLTCPLWGLTPSPRCMEAHTAYKALYRADHTLNNSQSNICQWNPHSLCHSL